MATRNSQIAVSQAEKETLMDVAEAKFGTRGVCYGAVVSTLANDYLESDN